MRHPSPSTTPDARPRTDAGAGSDSARCAVVVTTEFGSEGGLTVIDTTSFAVSRDRTAIHGDATVYAAGGRVFVLNRSGADSIQELDPAARFRTLTQRTLGRGANPSSLVVAGDTAWVASYRPGRIVAFDVDAPVAPDIVATGSSIDAGAEADGQSEVAALIPYDGILYAVIQGLDAYPVCSAGYRGRLVALDPVSLEPVPAFDGESALTLSACNPTSHVLLDDGILLIGYTGNHRVMERAEDDGGLEIVDLRAGVARGLIAREADFGGSDLVGVAADGTQVWLALADSDFAASVRPVTLEPFGLGEVAWRTDHGGVFDLAIDDGFLWIADRSLGRPGVVVLDARSGELAAGPLDTGFPPFDLAFVDAPQGCN